MMNKDAVVNQLNTIRAIVTPTIKIYENTEDLAAIQPNLDMIILAINSLREQPPIIEMPMPKEPDILHPNIMLASPNFDCTTELVDSNKAVITITNLDCTDKFINEDLFGDKAKDKKVVELELAIPLNCGETYKVVQINPALSIYQGDSDIIENNGSWSKTKDYNIITDIFKYSILLQEGRHTEKIELYDKLNRCIIFEIKSHIHFVDED